MLTCNRSPYRLGAINCGWLSLGVRLKSSATAPYAFPSRDDSFGALKKPTANDTLVGTAQFSA